MEELTRTRLIVAALSTYPQIDRDKWFDTAEGYKVNVIDLINSEANHGNLKERLSEAEKYFIRTAVDFFLIIHPQPTMSCSFRPNSNFDLPKCRFYKSQVKSTNSSEVICSQNLTLQERLAKCSQFKEKIIREAYDRANTYVKHSFPNLPSVNSLYSIKAGPV
jgi:hypothetical protein